MKSGPALPLADLLAQLVAPAAELEAFGATAEAAAVRETVRRCGEALTAWWNEPLPVAAAAAWGGYTESGLRRALAEGKIPVAPCGGIRRRHIPVRPGHALPVDVARAPVAPAAPIGNLLERHRQSRLG